MSSDKSYTADKLSFKERCAEAKNGLRELYKMIQGMAEEDLLYRQEAFKREEAILNVEEEFVRQEFLKLMGPITSAFEGIQEGLLKARWNNGVDFERRVFGSDAVDFALKELEKERQHN